MQGPEPEKKYYKDAGLNDTVMVPLPVHVAYGFLIEYSGSEWKRENANMVASAVIRELFDPAFLTEREAEQALQEEKHKAMHERAEGLFLGGQAIQMPPGFPWSFGGGEPA